MKDIPGTITNRFSILLSASFDKGHVVSSYDNIDLEIEEVLESKNTIEKEYKVASIITDPEEIEMVIGHFKFLSKYRLT